MNLKKNKLLLWAAIALMLISMIGASLVQSSGGTVKVTDVKWVNSYGKTMTGIMLIPENATAENPAPAIVCSHGFLNNKEMQDLNYVELARRGYVVLSSDMVSHGNSEVGDGVPLMTNCVYEGVQFLSKIDFVDNTRIGVTGHSFGGLNCNIAAALDNMNDPWLISAVLVNSMDPTYVDGEGNYANIYGNRNVGVIAGMYDEFGFNTVDSEGNAIPKPDYIHSPSAQSFLYFGQDPTGLEERSNDTIYTENVDGKECIRVIYTPEITHPWSHFSQRSTTATISFFEKALPAPNPLPATNQIWQWKVVFNTIGLIGFGLFIAAASVAFVNTAPFQSLRAAEAPVPLKLKTGKAKAWFWASLVIGAVYGAFSYLPVMKLAKAATFAPTLLGQSAVYGISIWAMSCALVSVICMFIGKAINGGANELASCLKLGAKNLFKTIVLAALVAASAFMWVFIANYFFHVDFRIWVLAAKAFNSRIFVIAIPYMLLLSVFYVVNSISVNCFNFNEIGGKKWLNILVLAVFNVLPAVIVLVLQYTYFKAYGFPRWTADQTHLFVVWLYPLLVMLPASAIISRYVFKATKNPYLPGFTNAIVIALMSCANTCTFM